ncbi:phage tail protein [Macrococcoides caseolyticum]|uniref:Uncharacterized protein n=1 Tax=Macrococcoides caseolyticum TaxID=69966 RepID=A0ACC9MQF2_9STAP|nr:phage tail protein [Macrococcus caseolyticus]PKE38491.1 hypothetical protein CW675_10575 [Macrococcus caseolyticus]PKE55650.1 hypothetical protein CW682_10635 [Macrococcus caseolyticus]
MYTVNLKRFDNTDKVTIWDYRRDDNIMKSGTLDKSVDQIDEFKFELINDSRQFESFLTLVEIKNELKNKIVFRGRILIPSQHMAEDGIFNSDYTVEGAAAYMHDSYPSYKFFESATPKSYITFLVNEHNKQVESYKQIKLGAVNFTMKEQVSEAVEYDTTKYAFTYLEKTIWQHIVDDCIGRWGGEILVRYEADGTYIDWLDPVGTKKDAALRIGKNIKSFSKSIDPTNVVTRLIPLGPAEESAAGQSQRLTIVEDSRSGGKNYIDIPELQKIYGIQNGIEIFEDEYTPDTLYNAAKRKVDDIKKNLVKQQMQINLLDLSYIGIDPDEYERGHQYEVFFEPFDVKEWMRIISTNEDITNPHNKSVVIGEKPLSIDDVQKSIAEQRTKLLQRKLDNFNQKLNDSISNVNTIVQDTLDTELQHYEKKIIKSDTPPTNAVNDVFWLDTSNPSVPILKRYWESQWIKASVDNAEDIGGITREKALFSELTNTFINLTIQHSKLLNEMHEVMNSEYLVDEDIKTLLNTNLDKTVTVFNNIKTNLESMNEDTATIGKLIDTQTLFLKYREQLQALYKVVEQAKLSIDARFKLLQSQYTDEKFNEAMENVAKTLPNGKWNADTKTLTSDVPNQDKLDSIVNDLKLFVNNQDNALETKIGKSVDAKIVDTKNEFTRQFTEVNSKVDKLSFENRNLIEGTTLMNKDIKKTWGTYNQLHMVDIVSANSKLKVGDTVTLSFDVQMTDGTYLRIYDSNGQIDKTIGEKTYTNIGNTKQRLSYTTTLKASSKNNARWMLAFYNNNNGDKFTIENIKLEFGSKATPYSIAPEDIDKSINDVKVKVETVEGGLTATNKKFETVYSKTETEQLLNSNLQPIKTDVNSTKSSIEQLDKEIKTKVSQTTYTTDQANVVQRLNSADSERQQLSNQIADRVTLTEYNSGIEAIEQNTDQKLTTMKTEIIQDGKKISQEVSQQIYNASSKTLNQTLSQYINSISTGHQFTYDENGNISNFTVGSSGIKLNGRVIDMNDGDVIIKNGVTTITDAYIPKLFSKQATIEYLDAIGITARTLQARDKQASVNIENGSITMNRDNGARMDVGLDGIQSFNSGGSLRFSLTQTLVTTSAVGTSVSNVYLGTAPTGEARVVDMNGIPGDGAIGSYSYRPLRTLAIKFPLKANGYIGIDGNELRIMSDGLNDGGFKNIRADKGYFATVDMNNEINGTHFYIRPKPGGELRATYNNGGDTSYANIRSDGIYVPWIDYNGHIAGSHFYIRPAYGGEVRLTNTGTTDQFASLRSNGIYVPWIDFNGQIPGSHLYIRPGSGGEVRFTKTGTTDQFINIRANDGDFNQISYNKWVQKSREEWKTGIRKWEVNASEVLINEVDIYEFYYKNDLDYLTRGSVIGDGYKVPDFWLSKSKNGIDNTSVIWTLAKALQEQIKRNNDLENRLKILEDKLNG